MNYHAGIYIRLSQEDKDKKYESDSESVINQKEILREIKKVIDEQLPPRDVASEYKVIDEIPLTSIGKVNYKELEEKEKQLVLKKN